MEQFKLTSNKSISNLHLYNKKGAIHKYNTIYQIIDEHYYTRMEMYSSRKEYQLNNLMKEIMLSETKMRFIQNVIDEEIIIYKQSKDVIIDRLRELEYPFYENNDIFEYDKDVDVKSQYNYLLNLSIYNFTLEKVEDLSNGITSKREEHDKLESMDIKDIWRQELDVFEEKYNEWKKK